MGYRENQFYNFPGGIAAQGNNDNPPFAYPGNSVHTMGRRSGSGDRQVKRGFIKSLFGDNEIFTNLGVEATSEVFSKRMFFQFNPWEIRQRVDMNANMAHPLLQDPGQFTQPIPGASNFNFEIVLDRQAEMNSAATYDEDRGGVRADPTVEIASDPSDIGVFADLKVLYQIIGQGLNAEQIQAYRALASRFTGSTYQPSDTAASSAAALAPTGDSTIFGSSDIDPNVNSGNNAFLAPLPVRVVFSSLFMVDGFVTGTSVLYSKFNANMVPIQCTVSISMQAVYVGFAKDKTILNFALEKAQIPVLSSPSGAPISGGTGGGVDQVSDGDPADVAKASYFERNLLSRFFINAFNEGSQGSFRDKVLGSTPNIHWGFTNTNTSDSGDIISEYLETNPMSIQYGFTAKVFRDPPVNDDPDTPEGAYSVLIMEFSGSSSIPTEMNGSGLATTPTQWKLIRRVKTQDYEGVSYPLKDGEVAGSKLFLPEDVYNNQFKGKNKLLKIEVDFAMSMRLESREFGPTVRNYSRKIIKYISADTGVFNLGFDIRISGLPDPSDNTDSGQGPR